MFLLHISSEMYVYIWLLQNTGFIFFLTDHKGNISVMFCRASSKSAAHNDRRVHCETPSLLRPVLQLMYWQTHSYCTYTTLPPPYNVPDSVLPYESHNNNIAKTHTRQNINCCQLSCAWKKPTPGWQSEHLLSSWERWERNLHPPFQNELFVLHRQPQTLIKKSCLQMRGRAGV